MVALCIATHSSVSSMAVVLQLLGLPRQWCRRMAEAVSWILSLQLVQFLSSCRCWIRVQVLAHVSAGGSHFTGEGGRQLNRECWNWRTFQHRFALWWFPPKSKCLRGQYRHPTKSNCPGNYNEERLNKIHLQLFPTLSCPLTPCEGNYNGSAGTSLLLGFGLINFQAALFLNWIKLR